MEAQLCFEIKTFLLAGHETSAAMLTWTLYELTRNGQAMGRVVSEAERVFGKQDEGTLPTREALGLLDYTLAALKAGTQPITRPSDVIHQLTSQPHAYRTPPVSPPANHTTLRRHLSANQPTTCPSDATCQQPANHTPLRRHLSANQPTTCPSDATCQPTSQSQRPADACLALDNGVAAAVLRGAGGHAYL